MNLKNDRWRTYCNIWDTIGSRKISLWVRAGTRDSDGGWISIEDKNRAPKYIVKIRRLRRLFSSWRLCEFHALYPPSAGPVRGFIIGDISDSLFSFCASIRNLKIAVRSEEVWVRFSSWAFFPSYFIYLFYQIHIRSWFRSPHTKFQPITVFWEKFNVSWFWKKRWKIPHFFCEYLAGNFYFCIILWIMNE